MGLDIMGRRAKPWWRESHGAYYATINGKQERLSEDKDEADRIFYRLMLDRQPGKIARSRETVAQLCDLYLDDAKVRLKPVTFERYKGRLQDFCDHAGSIVAEDLKPITVTNWLAKHPTWNANTRSLAITIVKIWSRWCKRQGCLERDPFADISRPSITRRKMPPKGAMDQAFDGIRCQEFKDFLILSLMLGTRPGELRTLTASRIDLEAGVATVSGKTGERRVMIPEAARAILEAQMKRWPEGPIMRNTKGEPWRDNAISAQMQRARQRVGIKGVVTYHARGAFATRAIKNGVPSLLVSKLLGHSDPRIVAKFYEQLDEGDLKDAAERASQTTTPGSTSSSAPKPDA